eukprot:Nitzschia sp. Nitz4//scaffold3_size479765//381173//381631//NITZ4_000161-RA/size479765-processed-gene-1.487-mRNA-1//1//CDS//3329550941//8601//frame0
MLIDLAPQYGWVVLGAGVGSVVTSFYLSGLVMAARAKYDVPYPNGYGTPGYHKKADEFNRVQRGHLNYLEGLGVYVILALFGGLKYPLANAVASVSWHIGSILYFQGYADTSLDVKTARFMKGGPIFKITGLLISLVSSCMFAYDLITSSSP